MKKKTLEEIVKKIISDVRVRGNKALLDYTRKFDGVRMGTRDLRVPERLIKKAYCQIDSKTFSSIKQAVKNIKKYQKKRYSNLKKIFPDWKVKKLVRTQVSELYRPLDTIGIYVPGGRYPYPSTVLMTAIPARVAGVRKIIVVTPPKKLTNEVLVACDLCEVSDIYRVGGAQAIAALTYGTETIPRVDKIFGPGNRYVVEAKKIVFGEVGIDMLAGPTEVIVLADKYAKLEVVLADLMAQKEHAPDARAILITPSKRLFYKVKMAKCKKIEVIRVRDLKEACKIINQLAPEHLEIMVKNPLKILPRISNVGAIFVGDMTPVAIGDYWAGPSHVLPTGGASRFSSGLGLEDFLKRTSLVFFTKEKLDKCARHVVRLAEIEGLKFHAQSIKMRLKSYPNKKRRI